MLLVVQKKHWRGLLAMKKSANPKDKWHCVDLDWAFNREIPTPPEKTEEPTMLSCYKGGYKAGQDGLPVTSAPKLRLRLRKQWELGWKTARKNKKTTRKPSLTTTAFANAKSRLDNRADVTRENILSRVNI